MFRNWKLSLRSPCTYKRPPFRCVSVGCKAGREGGLSPISAYCGRGSLEEPRLFYPLWQWTERTLYFHLPLPAPLPNSVGIIFLQMSWPEFAKMSKFSLLDPVACPTGAFPTSTNSNDAGRWCFSVSQVITSETVVNTGQPPAPGGSCWTFSFPSLEP